MQDKAKGRVWVRENYTQVLESYRRSGNVWKVAEELGAMGQAIHFILSERGDMNKMNYFTKQDSDYLLNNYLHYRDNQKLEELARLMGRTKPFLARKAGEIGLTDVTRPRICSDERRKELSYNTKKFIKEKGHPKGMLGKKQSEDMKANASVRSKAMWADPKSKLRSPEMTQMRSDRAAAMQAAGVYSNGFSRAKKGTVIIGEKTILVKSSWEANIAAYLEWLKGAGLLREWYYESDSFWFPEVKREIRSYKPDFKVEELNGHIYFLEVKGWMDQKSKLRLQYFSQYYPDVDLRLIRQVEYEQIEKDKKDIPLWGLLNPKAAKDNTPCNEEFCKNKKYRYGVCRKHFYAIYKTKDNYADKQNPRVEITLEEV